MTSPLIIINFIGLMVLLTGLEPVRCYQQGILSPRCLPFPPQEHIYFFLFPYLVYILYTKNKELSIKNLVSVVGFEPTVSCLKGKCINRLCYTLIFFGKFLQDFLSKILQKFFQFFSFSLNLIIYYIIKFRGFQVNC